MAKLVPSQVRLRTAIDTRWPGRDRRSDGWIADSNHKPPSEHIPDAKGNVRALDVDRDGIHVPSVLAAMLVHAATWYVIWNRKIYSRSDLFRPRVYSGSNPHTGHLHRSTLITADADSHTGPYGLVFGAIRWPNMRKGATGQAVRELQALLDGHGAALAVDGAWGDSTDAAVRAFQARHQVPHSVGRDGRGDGVVGINTKRALITV